MNERDTTVPECFRLGRRPLPPTTFIEGAS